MYCVRCKLKTESNNSIQTITANNRKMLTSNFAQFVEVKSHHLLRMIQLGRVLVIFLLMD